MTSRFERGTTPQSERILLLPGVTFAPFEENPLKSLDENKLSDIYFSKNYRSTIATSEFELESESGSESGTRLRGSIDLLVGNQADALSWLNILRRSSQHQSLIFSDDGAVLNIKGKTDVEQPLGDVDINPTLNTSRNIRPENIPVFVEASVKNAISEEDKKLVNNLRLALCIGESVYYSALAPLQVSDLSLGLPPTLHADHELQIKKNVILPYNDSIRNQITATLIEKV